MKFMFRCVMVVCAAFLLSACDGESLPRGVVAQVNGQPIFLRTLETLLDTRTAGLGAFEKPSLTSLRKQYGTALGTLIMQVLVVQELDALGIPVTAAEVQNAERCIRQDYAEDEFEGNLRENAIDLDSWRELLRYRLSMGQFQERVLRPRLAVPLPEIEAYYAEHAKAFTVPRMLTICQVVGMSAASLEDARNKGLDAIDDDEAQVYRMRLRHDRVPPAWQKNVRNLKVGEFSPVRSVDGHFEMLLLVEDVPQKTFDIVDAYPYVEQVLLEGKLEEAFQIWLEKKLRSADIRVSVHLTRELLGDPA